MAEWLPLCPAPSKAVEGMAGWTSMFHCLSRQQFAQFFNAGGIAIFIKNVAIENNSGNSAHSKTQDVIYFRHLFYLSTQADAIERGQEVVAQLPMLAISQT